MMWQDSRGSYRVETRLGLVWADKSSANDRDIRGKNKWEKRYLASQGYYSNKTLYSSMSDSSISSLHFCLDLQTYDFGGESKIPSTTGIGSLSLQMPFFLCFKVLSISNKRESDINNKLISTGMEHKNWGELQSHTSAYSLITWVECRNQNKQKMVCCSFQRVFIFLIIIGVFAVQPDNVCGLRNIGLVFRHSQERVLKAVDMKGMSTEQKLPAAAAEAVNNTNIDPNQSSKRRVRRGSDPIHNRSWWQKIHHVVWFLLQQGNKKKVQ